MLYNHSHGFRNVFVTLGSAHGKISEKHVQLHMHYSPIFVCVVGIYVYTSVNVYKNSVSCWKVMNLQVVYFFFILLHTFAKFSTINVSFITRNRPEIIKIMNIKLLSVSGIVSI